MGVIYRGCVCQTFESVNLQLDTCHPYCKTHKKIHHVQINTILFHSQTAHSFFLFFSATKTSTRNIFYLLHSHKSLTEVWGNRKGDETHNRDKDRKTLGLHSLFTRGVLLKQCGVGFSTFRPVFHPAGRGGCTAEWLCLGLEANDSNKRRCRSLLARWGTHRGQVWIPEVTGIL